MSVRKKSRRPNLIQLRLSTLIASVLTVGILIGLNTVKRKVHRPMVETRTKSAEITAEFAKVFNPGADEVYEHIHDNEFGWPIAFGKANKTYDGPPLITSKFDDGFNKGRREITATITNAEVSYSLLDKDDDGAEVRSSGTIPLKMEEPWNPLALAVDALVGTVIVGLIAVVSESLIRRREARKT